MAGRVRAEVAEQESRMSELAELRHRLENALRRGEQGQRQLESRMRWDWNGLGEGKVIDQLGMGAKMIGGKGPKF